ncbi:VWA domain-containing protein [Candidatus Babeliales bacterium]|nr:VWA domain-containing protein [Candidatus Babeliales bacterium]
MIPYIYYAHPSYVCFLPLFIAMIGLSLYLFFSRNNIIKQMKSKKFFSGYSQSREIIRCTIFIAASILLFMMLLRPQWTKKETVIPQKGRDILILLDISRSMRASDIKPNRLDAAKLKIKQLLRTLSCERVGLILFSGSAFIQCPLTRDFSSLELFIDHVDIETISSGTTALDKALQLGIELFSHVKNRKHKTILAITDGEDFSTHFEQIIDQSIQENITICTLGVGTEKGAPIPIFNQSGQTIGVEKDRSGATILSKLNTTFLQEISKKLNGFYTSIKHDNSDISALRNFFESIEKETIDNESLQQWEDRYYIFAQILFPLLLLEWFL